MRRSLPEFIKYRFLLTIAILFFGIVNLYGTNYYSRQNGNWTTNTTWSLSSGGGAVGAGVYPVAGDVVYIEAGDNVTVTADAACASLTFSNTGATVTVNSTFTLSVSGAITANSSASTNWSNTITGAGTLSCTSLVVGIDVTPSADRSTTLTTSIANLTITGNLSLYSSDNGPRQNNANLNLSSGIVTIKGSVTSTNVDNNQNASTLTMATGSQNGTLIFEGTTPFNLGSGTNNITLNGTGATVVYSYHGAQTIGDYTYNNLTLSGSGIKTENAATVNGILSMEGTATISATPTFGAAATLQYKGSEVQTTGAEFPATFSGTGGVIINNASGVVLNSARTLNTTSKLTLTNGILTTTTTNLLSVTNTATTALSAGSTSSFIDGPVKWSIGTGTYTFPVGNGSGNYLPYKLVTSASSTPIITVQAFNTDAGLNATFGSPLTYISHTEYWQATLVSGTFTGKISLTRQTALSGLDLIGQSAAQTGSYSDIGGTASTPSINTSNNISSLGYFVMASNQNKVSSVVLGTQTGSVIYGTGGSVTYNVAITPNGGVTAGRTTLSLTGTALPNGATVASWSINPVTLPAGSSAVINVTLTISTTGATPAGTTSGLTVTAANTPGTSLYPTSILSGTQGLVVSPMSIAVTANSGQAKIYGASDPTFTYSATPALGSGDSFTGSLSRATGESVGTYAFTLGTLTAGTNYSLTVAASPTFSITAKPIVITDTAGQTKVFGASDPTFTYSATPALGSGDSFTGSLSRATGESVGTYAFTLGTLTAGTNYSLTVAASPTFSITAKPITILANDRTKAYGDALTMGTSAYTISAGTLVNSDAISGVTLISAGAAASAAQGNYAITPSAAVFSTGSAGNYTITYDATGNLAVGTRPITILASDRTKTYGDVLIMGTTAFTVSEGTLVNSDAISGVTLISGGSAASAAQGNYNITPSLALFSTGSASNYTITYATTGNLTVDTRPITIKANDRTKTYGDALTMGTSAYTISVGTLVNSDAISGVTLISGGSAASSAQGNYAITPSAALFSTGSAGNYTITYDATGNLAVGTRPITITANNVNKTYGTLITGGAGSTAYSITSGTLQNGNTISSVTIAYGTGSSAASAVGTYTGQVTPSLALGANGFLSSNYNITYSPGDITVGTAPLTITANNVNKTYGTLITGGAGSTAYSITSGTLQNGNTISSVTIAYGTGSSAASAVGTYTGQVTPSLALGANGFLSSNYNITYSPGDIIVGTAPLTITANNVNKTYGTLIAGGAGSTAYSITSGTLQNGNTISSVTIAYGTGSSAASAVGTYTGQVAPSLALGANGFLSSNYNITYSPGDIIVGTAPLTITADNKTKAYGAAIPTLTITYTGLVNGNTAPATLPTVSTTALVSSAVGTYPITATGAADPNYIISYVAGTLTVDKVVLTITAEDKTKAYGVVLPTLTVTYTGLVNGNTAPATLSTVSTTALISSAVGTYPITATGAADPNYTITYSAGTLSVTAVPLLITAEDKTKAYGAALPTLTVTYTGLVNGNTAPATLPTVSTTALISSAVGTYPITATGAADPNYTITYSAGTLSVTAVPLLITADNKTKAYGAALPTLTVTYTGLVNGNTAPSTPPSISTTATASSPFGNYPITVTGAADPNYTITYVAGTLSVTAVPLLITAEDKTKSYGAVIPTLTVTYTGLVNGNTSPSTPPSVSTTATASSPFGNYPITATGAADPNYTITYAAGTLSVTAVPLLITADNKTKAYGTALPTLTVTYTGLVNGNTSPSTPPSVSTTATASSPFGNYPITATGAADPNYTITYAAGTLSVTAVPLLITADNKTKAYGAALPTLTVTYTGLVNGNTSPSTPPSISTTATASSPFGNYPITATGAADPNYTITYSAGTLSVDKVALTITAENKSKDYGAALPTLTVTYIGLVNGNTAPATLPTVSTTALVSSAVGTYPITATGAADPNYTITYAAGTLSVTAVPLLITADNKTKAYGAALPTLTVTYTGLVNGNTSPSTPPSISTSATSASPFGNYPITATGAADPNYTITYAAGTLSVTAVPLLITAEDKTKAYGAALPTLTVTYTGLVNGNTAPVTLPTVSTTALVSSAVGNYPITATGAADPNYTITYAAGTLSVDKVALTITAENKSKAYGAALPTLTVIYTGLVNGNTAPATLPTVSTTALISSAVGTYPITATGAADPNYTISYVAGTLTVDKVVLTITAENKSKAYGAALPTLTVTYTGLVNGNTAPATLPTVSTTALISSAVGTYPITATGAADPNYTISYAAGTLSVTAVPLLITADNKTKAYGAALPTLTVTYTGLVNGNTAPATLPTVSTTALISSAVGTYPITATGAADPNYTITYAAGTLTVTPITLTVTAKNNSKCFGETVTFFGDQFTSSGLINGDFVSSVTLSSSGASSGAVAGSYSVIPSNASGTGLANYSISYVNGTLIVHPLPQIGGFN